MQPIGGQPVVQTSFWQWIVDNGPGVSATVASISALVAIVTLIRASQDSRARSRPAVVAEFAREPKADTAFSLVIRNAGASIARDLNVTFDPPIPTGREDGQLADMLAKRYNRRIPTLAPGQELRSIYAVYGLKSGQSDRVNLEPTPADVTVHVSYRGQGRKRYLDTFDLISESVTLDGIVSSSTSVEGRLKTVAEESKKISEAIQSLANRGR